METRELTYREYVYLLIDEERDRQERLHGEFNETLSPFDHMYMTILGEEKGEACQALLNHQFHPNEESLQEYENELTQVAAVAVAILEKIQKYKNDA